MKRRLIPALSVAGIIALTPAVAIAAGSDGPTPYDVTEAGVTLPDGETFPAHGHVNIEIDGAEHGIHFVPNKDHPGSKWIGESFLPWTAFDVDSGCVEWVQISTYNEHFGEGGQDPVCFGNTEPTPTPELSREFTATCDAFGLVATSTGEGIEGRYSIIAQEYDEDGQTLISETPFEGEITWGEEVSVSIEKSESLLLWVYRVDAVDSPNAKSIVGEYPINCLPAEEPGEDDSVPLTPLEPATPIEKDDPIPLTPLEPATPIEPVDDTPAPTPQEPVETPQVKKPVTVPTGIPAGAPTPVVATPRMAG